MDAANESQHPDDFNYDWEALTFTAAPNTNSSNDWLSADDWEERYVQDTTGYVSDPLSTSFTDLDLSEARSDLRNTTEWADLDSWSDA